MKKKQQPKDLPADLDFVVLPGPKLRMLWGGKAVDIGLTLEMAKRLAVQLAGAVLDRERVPAEKAVLN